MRSTDSSCVPTQRQEEETDTLATESCASTGTQSPPPWNPTPPTTTPTPSAPAALAPARRRTILRPRRQRPEREEDRLIDALEAMSHPVPKLSCEAFFLLSLEDKMKVVPSSRQTELRDALTRCIDSFIPPDGSSQPPTHPHATPTHPKHTHKQPCTIHTT